MMSVHQGKQEGREILIRLIGAEIGLVQQGYAVRRALDGMKNEKVLVGNKERHIRVPNLERSHYFQKMFQFRSEGIDDKETVNRLNAMGFLTRIYRRWDRSSKENPRIIGQKGGVSLTVKQLQRYIQQTEYAGIICEKWTHNKPVKAKYDGLVSIEVFNKANHGKVFIDYKNEVDIKILYNQRPEKVLAKKLKYNPNFPNKFVRCPICGGPMLGSAPRGKSGKHYSSYHCARGHERFAVRKEIFDKAVESFIESLRFESGYVNSMEATFLNKYREREKEILNDSAYVHRSISDLQTEQSAKIDALVGATSNVVKRKLEEDIEKLESQIEEAKEERQRIDITEGDIKSFIKEVKKIMEHPAEILMDQTNPVARQALLGLVFEEMPTYAEIVNGTPKLTWIFKLSSNFIANKSHLAALRGIEPLFLG